MRADLLLPPLDAVGDAIDGARPARAGVVRGHGPSSKARRAAATARSTSRRSRPAPSR
jgi:hypothetical protein